MRSLHLCLLSVAVSLLAGCVQAPKKQAFNREAAGHITAVTLARTPNQDEYEAAVIGHPAASFGLIGGLIAAADTASKTSRLTKAIDPVQVRAQERLAERLSSVLKESGYRVTVTSLPKETPETAAVETAKRAGAADAVIVVQLRAAYWAAGPYSDYLPRIVANVRKVDAGSGGVLYEDTITYGYAFPGQPTVHLASRPEFRFASIEALESDPAKARLGLLEGLEAIALQIAADLKR